MRSVYESGSSTYRTTIPTSTSSSRGTSVSTAPSMNAQRIRAPVASTTAAPPSLPSAATATVSAWNSQPTPLEMNTSSMGSRPSCPSGRTRSASMIEPPVSM